jgi:hypothetical protein
MFWLGLGFGCRVRLPALIAAGLLTVPAFGVSVININTPGIYSSPSDGSYPAFTADDDIQLFGFTLGSATAIDLQTISWANPNIQGFTPLEGFTPQLSLYYSNSGYTVGSYTGITDGGGDPICNGRATASIGSTSACLDAQIQTTLGPGTYLLALSEYGNTPLGDLNLSSTTTIENSFQFGPGNISCENGNFTGDPSCLGYGSDGNPFYAFYGANPELPGGWALDVTGTTGATSTPEPGSFYLILTGLAGFAAWKRRDWI